MKKVILLLMICCFIILKGKTQHIKITVSNQTLNKVLIDLRDNYGAEFSFNDTETAKYKVSVKKRFNSLEDALDFLFKRIPLSYEKSGNVYVIYSTKDINEDSESPLITKRKIFLLSGCVSEYNSGEALPFSVIVINETGIVTDEFGKFSFASEIDSIFNLQISHLGYYITDTIVHKGVNKNFKLLPSVHNIEEVIVKDRVIETFNQIGEEAGKTKLNHLITRYLPGCNDNSVFNLLRLQPGIMASAEQTNDMIIWGAYQGQSQVLFDGFTLFGLKNFNDNISAVNPYMVQHMQIHKAGYDAAYGGRVGGIVEINGKNGNTQKPSIDLSVSNFTVNGLIQLPISKNSSLQVAGRKTYYELYNAEDIPILNKLNENSQNSGVINNFKPDYDFKDLNIKYSLRTDIGDVFYISMLGGKDNFSYDFERLNNNLVISKKTAESNMQAGTSVFFGKTFKNGFNTNMLIGYSGLTSQYSDSINVNRVSDYSLNYSGSSLTNNKTEEYKVKVDGSIPISEEHFLEGGFAYVKNISFLKKDTFDINYVNQKAEGGQFSFFMQDKVNLNRGHLKFGGRINYLPYINDFYFEPRISFSADLTEYITLNSALGRYRQFVIKSSVVDDYGNYKYIWTVANNIEIPVLDATHFVSGLSFQKGGFSSNFEIYSKRTYGLTRFVEQNGIFFEEIYEGQSKSIGVDVFVKQNLKGHSIWFSYSLGKTTELFEYHKVKIFRPAPHNQSHEIKVAGMIDLDPFYFSSNYVYGSGFTIFTNNLLNPIFETGIYSRLDAAAVCKFSKKRFFGEVGISILNVLNKENIKISNFERVPVEQTSTVNIYNDPIPFTPTLYLKIGF